MILKIRSKPTYKEAIEFKNGMTIEDLSKFITCDFDCSTPGDSDVAYAVKIPTLEGEMTANIGDFIIKGLRGEFYPCKSDVFHKSYEVLK